MRFYFCGLLKVVVLFIGFNCSSQDKRTWVIHSTDSIISANHYYDNGTEKLDSLEFKYGNRTSKFPVLKDAAKKNETVLKYKDSLSMPFDLTTPSITQIINLNTSTFIAIGNNKGVEKEFSNYLNILIISKSDFKIKKWITALIPRGNYNPQFLIDEKKEIISLIKESNQLLEDKIYVLDYKKIEYTELNSTKHTWFIGNNSKIKTPVFKICY